jgi:hypothetical protein
MYECELETISPLNTRLQANRYLQKYYPINRDYLKTPHIMITPDEISIAIKLLVKAMKYENNTIAINNYESSIKSLNLLLGTIEVDLGQFVIYNKSEHYRYTLQCYRTRREAEDAKLENDWSDGEVITKDEFIKLIDKYLEQYNENNT